MATDSVSPATRAKLARSVLQHNLRVRSGERVIVEAWTHTLPWAIALAREARHLGALPLVTYEDEPAYWEAVEDGQDALLGKAPAHEWAALGKTDVYIHLWGPSDRVRLERLPEARLNRLLDYNAGWYSAAEKAGVRGARLEVGRVYPTNARAYGVDPSKWMDQLVSATMVAPDALARAGAPIARAFGHGKRVRIRDDQGTDLTLGLAHRRAVTMAGRPDTSRFGRLVTLPSGMVRVALDETVAEGTIAANRASYYQDGKATGGVLRFRRGRLVSAEFDHGEDRFKSEFKKGGKGRDRPGWMSIGLNPHMHDTPPDEDEELGAVTVSVGGNRNLGGNNPSPFFGWVVNGGATVEVDGRPLVVHR